jgi:hypothetical protein
LGSVTSVVRCIAAGAVARTGRGRVTIVQQRSRDGIVPAPSLSPTPHGRQLIALDGRALVSNLLPNCNATGAGEKCGNEQGHTTALRPESLASLSVKKGTDCAVFCLR